MNRLLYCLVAAALVVGCANPSRLVYASGFTFADFDYLIVAKPDAGLTGTALYGMDVEFANLMGSYNLKVIGDKEYARLPKAAQERTLRARLSLTAANEFNILTVSFDVRSTGATGSSITVQAKGDIMKNKGRTKLLEELSATITTAMERDKGLTVRDGRK